jgi:hypothetical protein
VRAIFSSSTLEHQQARQTRVRKAGCRTAERCRTIRLQHLQIGLSRSASSLLSYSHTARSFSNLSSDLATAVAAHLPRSCLKRVRSDTHDPFSMLHAASASLRTSFLHINNSSSLATAVRTPSKSACILQPSFPFLFPSLRSGQLRLGILVALLAAT